MNEPSRETVAAFTGADKSPTGGHLACQGCGGALALQMAIRALDNNCVLVIPAGCMAVIDGPFPSSALGVPLLHIAFEAAASAAAGVRAGLDAQGKEDVTVVAWAGDGATFDIGFGAVSASAARNDNILYVCYDNEAYMNTGVQQSSATPLRTWTTTTPQDNPKGTPKKDIMSIMAAHRIPYFATASPSHPDDYLAKLKKMQATRGFRFLHLFTPCPPGQRFEEKDTIKVSRTSVSSRVFPLVEITDGTNLTIQAKAKQSPVREYLNLQARFSHMNEDQMRVFEEDVEARWNELIQWEARSAAERI